MAALSLKPSQALLKARELITPEGAWTQGEYARNALGDRVSPGSREAVCFCAYGAIRHIDGNKYNDSGACLYLRKEMEGDVIGLNDKMQHAEVLDAFDRAAALAESEGR